MSIRSAKTVSSISPGKLKWQTHLGKYNPWDWNTSQVIKNMFSYTPRAGIKNPSFHCCCSSLSMSAPKLERYWKVVINVLARRKGAKNGPGVASTWFLIPNPMRVYLRGTHSFSSRILAMETVQPLQSVKPPQKLNKRSTGM